LNILVVGIVTTPFHWEGIKRNKVASMGIAALSKFVDSIIVIPNDKLLSKDAEGNDFITTFKKIDNILVNAARGIVDIIDNHSFINVDFADVCTIMENSGRALMGIGTASGDNRATEAANAALNSPFLDNVTVEGAKGVLVKISAGELKMDEIDTVMEVIRKAANYENGSINEDDEFDNFGFDDDIKFEMKNLDDNVIFGCDLNPALGDKLQVTLIATDLNKKVTPQTNILNSQNVNFNNQINTNTNEKAQEIDTKVLVEENNQQKVANDEYVSTYKPPVNFPGLNFTSNKDNGNGRHLAKVPRGNDLSSFDSPAVDRRGDSSYQRNMLRNN